MKESKFILTFVLLTILQLILAKYCQIGPYIYVSLLPAMILCYPTSRPLYLTMLIAFASGLAVDGLADGVLGLNAAAAVAVAFVRNYCIILFIDNDIVERHYSISFKKNGMGRITIAVCLELAIFLLIYIILDSAGTRSFGFNSLKFLISFAIGIPFNLCTVKVLTEEKN